MTEPYFIDTHAHLHLPPFADDLPQVLERATDNGVGRIIEIGYNLDSSRAALALAEAHPQIYAVVGVQPNYAVALPGDWLAQVRALAHHPKVVAIGEIGLDFYWNKATPEQQETVFCEQLALARELRLPVVIHSREAQADTVRVLRAHAIGQPGVMHSFSGDWAYALQCLEIGFYLSLAGPVTFSKAHDLHDVARRAPLDRLLTETDCPYLTPHPHRGKRNEPAYVRLVAERIATLRGLTTPACAEAVWYNAAQAFSFAPVNI
ncbi:MAG: TatD family hydrolase [Chloroflexaceae bacterium]|nr:TatD family hydrolase [Chloroflexaceae bacterium]